MPDMLIHMPEMFDEAIAACTAIAEEAREDRVRTHARRKQLGNPTRSQSQSGV